MISNKLSIVITNSITNAINGNGGFNEKIKKLKFHFNFLLSNAYGMFSFVCEFLKIFLLITFYEIITYYLSLQ